jgi:sarcosine oxidase/L-pipecolate oxidase
MPANVKYDLIVIGGGSIGQSTAFHAAKRGLKTAIFEQFGFLNDDGSSAGWSRQFRLQYAVQYMAELCLASVPFWEDLQKYSGAPLIGKDGSLWFGNPKAVTREGGIAAAEKVMDKLGIKYKKLADGQQIEREYHFRNIAQNYSGFFQAQGGTIDLKAAQLGLYNGNVVAGVDLHPHVKVTGINSRSGGDITVSTSIGDYTTTKLAITAGAWVNDLTGFLHCHVPIIIWEMCSAYFKMPNPNIPSYETWFYYGSEKDNDKKDFYGFPVDNPVTGPWPHPGYIRVAPDFPDWTFYDPSRRHGTPDPENIRLTAQFVAEHMTGVDSTPHFASTCLAPLAINADQELLIDYAPASVPNNKQIVIYTGGWAAKFVPILGDMICQMLTNSNLTAFNYGQYSIPLSNFAIQWNELPRRRGLR